MAYQSLSFGRNLGKRYPPDRDALQAPAECATTPFWVHHFDTVCRRRCRYADLLEGAAAVSSRLFQAHEFNRGAADDATGPRVAILAQPGAASANRPEHSQVLETHFAHRERASNGRQQSVPCSHGAARGLLSTVDLV